ncbi:MAG: CusA/CzcA family heavy metal efflux RND transporter [Planctomycetes bacterium]|nr:CusA/CzcA family heavy metal efflux RND transporter [Planctomycetota bacterium]
MLNRLIAFSLTHRGLVFVAALALSVYGVWTAAGMKIDVLPDLDRPTVTVMTESPGLAPEEVERLVTFPIETSVNGASGVRRVRSASGVGLSIVWIEFDWGTDIYRDRQIVSEKMSQVRDRLPVEARPEMAPISSIMGEILLVSMTSKDGSAKPIDIRSKAEWAVRPRLLSVPGVSQVTVMGGGLRQIQVTTTPERLRRHDVTLEDLTEAVRDSNANVAGGFLIEPNTESLIRITGRADSLDDVRDAVVSPRTPAPVLVRDVADVAFGPAVARGDGSVDGKPAVILSIQKQPEADTVRLTAEVDAALAELQAANPDIEFNNRLFRQESFIRASIHNVLNALRDGTILVVIILLIFLWNVRTSVVNLAAIPLSLVVTLAVFHAFGLSINTMTLGGIAVAIGELVDDSIVDVENIFRRLRENRGKAAPENPLLVVYRASAEVRNSIVYATLVIAVALVPLMFLAGIEGRLFAPIGYAYLTALLSSLLVSLTVTPALSYALLGHAKATEPRADPALLRWLKSADRRILGVALRFPGLVLIPPAIGVSIAAFAFFHLGGEFLPPFNEGTFTVNVIAEPGTSLAESNRLGATAEALLHEVPEIVSTARRTGRAEMDEHAEGVNSSEIEVVLKPGRPRDEVMSDIRERLSYMTGAVVNLGQPISHRIDHLMSGVRAQLAVKIYGPDLEVLRDRAAVLSDRMAQVPGVVDLQVERQFNVPEVRVSIRRDQLKLYGLSAGHVAEVLETALKGRTVSQVLQGDSSIDMLVWYDEAARSDPKIIERTLLVAPGGARIPLAAVADVARSTGPNTINREGAQRRVAVQCNVAGRDLDSVVADIRALEAGLKLPAGYRVEYGGQFEARRAAGQRIAVLSIFALIAIFLLLSRALESWLAALQCLVNLPLAFVGGVLAVWWFGDRTLSVASLIGFITLTGIVMRNGIMMISHYIHLVRHEGEVFGREMIIRGSIERLAPVLMTALTAGIGLVPLALGKGETGKEILHPLAIVVIGGLISSTLLDQFVTPALFLLLGRKIMEKRLLVPVPEETIPPGLAAAVRT